jgi:hypothetical protein
LLFHAQELSCLADWAHPGLHQRPCSHSWGQAVALPSFRLWLQCWNQLNLRRTRPGHQAVFLAKYGVDLSLESLWEESINGRFFGLGVGHPLEAWWMGHTILGSTFCCPAGHQQEQGDTVKPSAHSSAQRSFPQSGCYDLAEPEAHLVYSSSAPSMQFQLNFSLKTSVAFYFLSPSFWKDI